MDRIQLSGCAIIDDDKLLLIWKKKHNHYEFPGGKVEVGETLEQTALRETKEEIDCDVKIIKYLGYKEFHIDNRDFRSHKYLAQIPQGQVPKIMEPELFRDIFWLPMRRYKEYSVAPNVKEFCEDYIDGTTNFSSEKRLFVKIKMNKQNIIEKTVEFVKNSLADAEGGHDWWHIYRVWKLAKYIAKNETADLFVVELGALLHDIADSKFYEGDETIGPKKAEDFLSSLNVEQDVIKHVVNIIKNISFKGGKHNQEFKSIELDIIQDADRLDAVGAIGIARTFNYGGHKNHVIYNPLIKPNLNMTKEEYKKSNAPTMNHFYEKLLLLKDLMNTKTGKEIAKHRHKFMEQYLDEFYKEWEGEL